MAQHSQFRSFSYFLSFFLSNFPTVHSPNELSLEVSPAKTAPPPSLKRCEWRRPQSPKEQSFRVLPSIRSDPSPAISGYLTDSAAKVRFSQTVSK